MNQQGLTSPSSSDRLPVLYSFRRCPYAMRARVALCYARQEVWLREIVLRDKPLEMLEISPKATVPVLQLPDGQVIDQSLDVMRWALAQHDPAQWWPQDATAQQQIMHLITSNDGAFKTALDRYKYPTRYVGVVALEQRAQGEVFLSALDQRLQQHHYLIGDQISLADAAIFPFVRQFAQVDPVWFAQTDYAALRAWLAAWLDSRWFGQAMTKFAQWQSGTLGERFGSD